MEAAFKLIFGNSFFLLLLIAIITTVVKSRRPAAARDDGGTAYIAWGELLFYLAGIGYAYTGLLHAYAQSVVAPSIGWAPSPFEYELGWMEIPLGAVAMMALWRGFEFRLAATIIFVTFAFAAAAQHIQQIVCCANHAPGNAGFVLWVADIIIPLVILVCAVIAARRRTTS